jgi:predicted dehydrogenase
MERLGVALVGLDHWYTALDLAPSVAASSNTRLVVVADTSAERAQSVAQDHSAEAWTTDFNAAIDRADVDIVIAMASCEHNAAICKQAAALGKHIVSLKPMAMNLAQADEVVAAVQAAGVHFFPMEANPRITERTKRFKTWLKEGRIGQPLRYTHTLFTGLPRAWRGSSDTNTWWLDPERVPGGAWLDHAIYAIDTVRWLFDSEPTSIQGIARNQRHTTLRVEDYGIATITFANGAMAVIEDTWTADPGFYISRNELIGSAGSVMELPGGRLALRGDFGFEQWLTLENSPTKDITPVEHLVHCIREETTPAATVDDARINLATCLAFYQAAREGRSVAL